MQSFAVPRGTTLITFTYTSPGLAAGLAASGAGLAAILILGLTAIAFSRRRTNLAGSGAAAAESIRPETPIPGAVASARQEKAGDRLETGASVPQGRTEEHGKVKVLLGP